MAYFNHAYSKVFLGTQQTGAAPNNPNVNLSNGFLITAGLPSVILTQTGQSNPDENYGVGSFGFFNPDTWESIDPALTGYNGCCPIVLASASLMTNDKVGPYHGGYKETNKSKIINPKYVQKIYSVKACVPQQAVTSIGKTPNPDSASCSFEFICSETYYLRIDVKGSPALRFLNHQAYQNIYAYTGCCPAGSPGASIDPTLVYLGFAKQIVQNNYLKPFIAPVVYDYTGVAWYAPGTTVTMDGTNTPVTSAQWWELPVAGGTAIDQYAASVQAAAWNSGLVNANDGGMRLFGAYVDTKFGDCSFQITDFFEKELVQIYASLVDINGDPCTFEGLCVNKDCTGVQGMGFGEQVLRDLIISQSYLQNFFATDIRIREITQGTDIIGAVDRNALYTRYYILHSVPRFNNPSGVFDNDRYLLEIIVSEPKPATPVGNPVLETFLANWSELCVGCATPEEFTCTHCDIAADK